MRIAFWLPVSAGLLAMNLSAATIQFGVSNLGSNLYQYDYMISGITFQANEELDIQFDPALYGVLSNGVAGSGFSLMLLQPNNPPGTTGVYSAYSLVNNPSLSGQFSVDFTYLGPGQPGSQAFLINQYNQNGTLVSTVASGETVSLGQTSVPEPVSFSLVGVGLLIGWVFRAAKRRFGVTA